jgi:hypothetical protein
MILNAIDTITLHYTYYDLANCKSSLIFCFVLLFARSNPSLVKYHSIIHSEVRWESNRYPEEVNRAHQRKGFLARHGGAYFVIPCTWEAEAGELRVQGQPVQSHQDPISKKTNKRAADMAQVIEHLSSTRSWIKSPVPQKRDGGGIPSPVV